MYARACLVGVLYLGPDHGVYSKGILVIRCPSGLRLPRVPLKPFLLSRDTRRQVGRGAKVRTFEFTGSWNIWRCSESCVPQLTLKNKWRPGRQCIVVLWKEEGLVIYGCAEYVQSTPELKHDGKLVRRLRFPINWAEKWFTSVIASENDTN